MALDKDDFALELWKALGPHKQVPPPGPTPIIKAYAEGTIESLKAAQINFAAVDGYAASISGPVKSPDPNKKIEPVGKLVWTSPVTVVNNFKNIIAPVVKAPAAIAKMATAHQLVLTHLMGKATLFYGEHEIGISTASGSSPGTLVEGKISKIYFKKYSTTGPKLADDISGAFPDAGGQTTKFYTAFIDYIFGFAEGKVDPVTPGPQHVVDTAGNYTGSVEGGTLK